MRIFIVIILGFLIITGYFCCDNEKDILNPGLNSPSVIITSPENHSIISKEVSIYCLPLDGIEIKRVELYINGFYTGISDTTLPFILTMSINDITVDSVLEITVKSYNDNGKASLSDPITVYYKNYFDPIILYPVVFIDQCFYIKWSKSLLSDFSNYKLILSCFSDMQDSTILDSFTLISDTTFILSDISDNTRLYFQIVQYDSMDYSSTSNIVTGSSYPKIYFEYCSSIDELNYEIYSMDLDGANWQNLSNNSYWDLFPKLSNDGKSLVYISQFGGYDFDNYEIMFLDLSTFISTQITHNYSSEISPLFTPDGEKILFERYDGNKYDLFLINKNGTGEQQLTFNGAQCPQFSPDGSKIVYYNPVNSMSEIFLLDLITNEIKTLTNRPNVLNSEPKYSPSGDLISYYSQDSVRVIDLQGNEIFSIPGYISSFSPSGDKIVFDKWEFKAMNIYIINSDGTDLLKLTDNADNSSIFCDRPVITPDGNSIIYERSVRGDFDEYLYIMNIDGSNKRILSDKIGEYSNVQIQPIL